MRILYLFLVLSITSVLVSCYNNHPTEESTKEGMPPMKVEQVEEVTTEQDNIDDLVGDRPPVPDTINQ